MKKPHILNRNAIDSIKKYPFKLQFLNDGYDLVDSADFGQAYYLPDQNLCTSHIKEMSDHQINQLIAIDNEYIKNYNENTLELLDSSYQQVVDPKSLKHEDDHYRDCYAQSHFTIVKKLLSAIETYPFANWGAPSS